MKAVIPLTGPNAHLNKISSTLCFDPSNAARLHLTLSRSPVMVLIQEEIPQDTIRYFIRSLHASMWDRTNYYYCFELLQWRFGKMLCSLVFRVVLNSALCRLMMIISVKRCGILSFLTCNQVHISADIQHYCIPSKIWCVYYLLISWATVASALIETRVGCGVAFGFWGNLLSCSFFFFSVRGHRSGQGNGSCDFWLLLSPLMNKTPICFSLVCKESWNQKHHITCKMLNATLRLQSQTHVGFDLKFVP